MTTPKKRNMSKKILADWVKRFKKFKAAEAEIFKQYNSGKITQGEGAKQLNNIQFEYLAWENSHIAAKGYAGDVNQFSGMPVRVYMSTDNATEE